LLAAWALRSNIGLQAGGLAYVLTLVGMTLIFPYAGARGGFFHAGAALQPLFWALTPVGLARFVTWGANTRGWHVKRATRVFGVGLLVLACLLSIFVLGERVIGWGQANPPWGSSYEYYGRLETELQRLGASPDDLVLVNNPPGYYLASQRQAIVIPDGDIQALLAAATRYQASYVLLEPDHPRGLSELYKFPHDAPRLKLLWSDGQTHILQVVKEP
jgi:hypothetical protein